MGKYTQRLCCNSRHFELVLFWDLHRGGGVAHLSNLVNSQLTKPAIIFSNIYKTYQSSLVKLVEPSHWGADGVCQGKVDVRLLSWDLVDPQFAHLR